jgi:hypothetical protein
MAYLDFALLYQSQCKLPWLQMDRESKLMLSALLLNGGNEIVDAYFHKRILSLNEDKFTIHSDLDAIRNALDEEAEGILEKLEFPWLAFDECHVPTKHKRGLLFHSDYKHRLDSGEDVRAYCISCSNFSSLGSCLLGNNGNSITQVLEQARLVIHIKLILPYSLVFVGLQNNGFGHVARRCPSLQLHCIPAGILYWTNLDTHETKPKLNHSPIYLY